MIRIPSGSFIMGDSSGNWDEKPVHKVTISEPFFVSKTEITIEQFSKFKKDYQGYTDYTPFATGVSWYEANEFCKWLSLKEKKNYRLPTEAEWEYVCINNDDWNIRNMLDPTLEWCSDWYGPYPFTDQTDPVGVEKSLVKVVRGGLPDIFVKEYRHSEDYYYRAANRAGIAPNFMGFTVPKVDDEIDSPTQNYTYSGLAGIIYDDLKMSKPLALHPIPEVNSVKLKWISMNNWTAKWQGFIESPFSGQIVFSVECDNNIEVEIDGKKIIKGSGKEKNLSGVASMIAGKSYPIQINYLHDGGESILKLFWSWEGRIKEIVRESAFSHGDQDKKVFEREYKRGIFERYVDPSIGFRIVQASELKSAPISSEPPYVQQCVKQNVVNPNAGAKGVYFRKRFLHPLPPDNSTREEIILSGLHPSFGSHNHHASIVVCPNGDLLAVYFTSEFEDAPEVSLMASRLRYGSDEWDMPSPIVDFPNVNDVSPLFWSEGNKIYLFWGNIHLKGGYPFQWIESTDNGASFSEVKFAKIEQVKDGFTPQPITSIYRDTDSTIYMACDGVGAQSLLWASQDNMKTWFDTGGRTGGRHTAIIPLTDGRFLGFGGKKSDIDGFMPISISTDQGKTWKISKSIFPCLGGGQRPALIRLKSGRLLFAGDFQRSDGYQPEGINKRGSFVALSSDEGNTWRIKRIPGTLESAKKEIANKMNGETIGYVSIAQSTNGMIHMATSKNAPALHFEFNEAWILSANDLAIDNPDLMKSSATTMTKVTSFDEKYSDGTTKARYSFGMANDGRFLLNGKEIWYYKNGKVKYQTEYKLGKKIGEERFFSEEGDLCWERSHENGKFIWIQFWENGELKSKSHWKNMKCDGNATIADHNGKIIKTVSFRNGKISK